MRQPAIGMLGLLLAGWPLAAQSPRNFAQQAFGTSARATEPMLGDSAPGFTLLIASQEPTIERTARPDVVGLALTGIPLRFEMRHDQWAGIDRYRIRQAPGSPLRGEAFTRERSRVRRSARRSSFLPARARGAETACASKWTVRLASRS